MSSTTKNIIVPLIILTLGFFGYRYFTSNSDSEIAESEEILTQDILDNTQVFIERRAVLNQIKVDTEIFYNPVFRSYKDFSTPLKEYQIGRTNPFGEVTEQNSL